MLPFGCGPAIKHSKGKKNTALNIVSQIASIYGDKDKVEETVYISNCRCFNVEKARISGIDS